MRERAYDPRFGSITVVGPESAGTGGEGGTVGVADRVWPRARRAAVGWGSIPFISAIAGAHYIDVALIGIGLPDDSIHAPNERFYLPNLFRGTETCIELYRHLGQG